MVWGSGPGQLVRGDTAPTDLHQGRQLDLVVGRAQVLDDLVPTPFLDRDLHRRGPRGGPGHAQTGSHQHTLRALSAPPPGSNTAIPTKTHADLPITHQGVMSQVRSKATTDS